MVRAPIGFGSRNRFAFGRTVMNTLSGIWEDAKVTDYSINGGGLDSIWEQWEDEARRSQDEAVLDFARGVRENSTIRCLLEQIFEHSPFLTHSLLADMAFAERLFAVGPNIATNDILKRIESLDGSTPRSQSELMTVLRRAKRQLAVTRGCRRHRGGTGRSWNRPRPLSRFAYAAIQASCRHLLSEADRKNSINLPDRDNPENGSGLIVLGMGKLGAEELNYSSDVGPDHSV